MSKNTFYLKWIGEDHVFDCLIESFAEILVKINVGQSFLNSGYGPKMFD